MIILLPLPYEQGSAKVESSKDRLSPPLHRLRKRSPPLLEL